RQSGRPAAADDVRLRRGDIRQVGLVASGRGVDPPEVALVEVDLGFDGLAQTAELPLGQVPPHRHGDGAELPRCEGGEDELGRVPEADPEAVAEAEAALGQRTGDLARPALELRPREGGLAAVDGDMDVD